MKRKAWVSYALVFAAAMAVGFNAHFGLRATKAFCLVKGAKPSPAGPPPCARFADTPPAVLPAGTPFADLAQARTFLESNRAGIAGVRNALRKEIHARHDRLMSCAQRGQHAERRMKLEANWHLRVARGMVEAGGFSIKSLDGDPASDAQVTNCFAKTFGDNIVASLVPGFEALRYSGAYPTPLTLDM